jgi:hypothetical protein
METIIQLTTVIPYEVIARLPFLYEKPKGGELYINEKKCIVDNIRDKIDENGNVTRLIRVSYGW